ncbi:MAG: DUF2064 domain-containing protein [Proteobacteria bacterium]|nr:DUF2064 domain-containing protein [Pseudomonadota bacterium]
MVETVATTPLTQPCALAVFVKTAELSPVKTRLAATLGKDSAIAVYRESLRLLQQQLHHAANAGVAVHYAVAEAAGVRAPCWQQYPAFHTGDGDLGQRLHQVYQHLRQFAPRVILIGADCPQLSAELILQAANSEHTVIGAAQDGGFYLFASSCSILQQQWTAPQYSSNTTREELIRALDDPQIELLPTLTDIDDHASLVQCLDELRRYTPAADSRGLAELLD